MIFEQIFTDPVQRTFSYVIADDRSRLAAVVDPAFGHDEIAKILKARRLVVEFIIHTHGHWDHAGGSERFRELHGGRIVAHAKQHPELAVRHRDVLPLGRLALEFFETPGHSLDSICILCEDKLLTGDTLFVGKVGGTHTEDEARTEYRSLHEVLMQLPDHLEVWPGHNFGGTPASTIGRERETNPFLLQPDFPAFFDLKKHWDEYKRKHGID